MNRRVTKFGEKILKEKAEKVSVFDGELKALAADLVDTMYEEKGLGLAAPQIGVSKKVFAIDMRQRVNTDVPCVFTLDGKELPLDLAMPLVAVNPEVEEIQKSLMQFYAAIKAYNRLTRFVMITGKHPFQQEQLTGEITIFSISPSTGNIPPYAAILPES